MKTYINSLLPTRLLVGLSMIFLAFSTVSLAQTDDPVAMKKQALQLMTEQKMTEALPLFEKLSLLTPNDAEVRLKLGFALLGQAANTPAGIERRKLRVRARDSFIRARDLGDNSELVTGMIEGLPEDGSESKGFSDNAAANKLMEQGEAAFSSGKLDDALGFYQDALKIDPRCYFAALFAGDVYLQKEKYTDAEAWYQRAITIDPNIETAYRYSATPLMKQKKYDEARDRYVEAFITDPYNKLAASGIIQWGQATNTKLGHPKIDIPETTIGADGKSNTTINVNPLADDGSMAWIAYSATREVWKKDKFAKTYPNEKVYRHSLQEEADALRSVVSMARSTKPKNLNSQIQMIEKMDKDGVLEAYILMAVPDRDIAQEFPDYLRSNRDKLRKYVVSYVIEQK
ncbi:MAG: tetratricopeptide repeat protein [Pyrinomonadaceae bacterium]